MTPVVPKSQQDEWLSEIRELIHYCREAGPVTQRETRMRACDDECTINAIILRELIQDCLRGVGPLVRDISDWFDDIQFANITEGTPVNVYSSGTIRKATRKLIEAARRIQRLEEGQREEAGEGKTGGQAQLSESPQATYETIASDEPGLKSVRSALAVKAVKNYINSKCLTPAQFAKRCGFTPRTLRTFYNEGKIGTANFQAMAAKIGVEPEQLYRGEVSALEIR